MVGYFKSMSGFCTDPATGKRRPIDFISLGFVILFSPILVPLYYLGVLGSIILGEHDD